VSATAADLKVIIPPLAREACTAAQLPPPPHPTREDFEIHATLQVGELEVCDRKRSLAVSAADLHNRYVDLLVTELRAPTLLERITGKRPPAPKRDEMLAAP
jgi:hypothetical protein